MEMNFDANPDGWTCVAQMSFLLVGGDYHLVDMVGLNCRFVSQ